MAILKASQSPYDQISTQDLHPPIPVCLQCPLVFSVFGTFIHPVTSPKPETQKPSLTPPFPLYPKFKPYQILMALPPKTLLNPSSLFYHNPVIAKYQHLLPNTLEAPPYCLPSRILIPFTINLYCSQSEIIKTQIYICAGLKIL